MLSKTIREAVVKNYIKRVEKPAKWAQPSQFSPAIPKSVAATSSSKMHA